MLSEFFASVVSYLFAWVVLVTCLSCLLALGYSRFAQVLKRNSLEHAAFFTLVYGFLAPAAASVSLLLLSLPKLAAPIIADHCHDVECTPHMLNMSTETIPGFTVVTLAVAVLTAVVATMLTQLMRARKKLALLKQLSDTDQKHFHTVESPAHLAWCTGLLKPEIYLSRGLLNVLSAQQLNIVLAHERSHVLRKDNLRKWCLHWVSIIWPRKIKAQIRQDLSNYTECICDVEAAQSNGLDAIKKQFIETVNACRACASSLSPSSASTGETSADDFVQSRAHALERALSLSASDIQAHKRAFIHSLVLISIIWITAVTASTHFGHPLLEWLSR